MMKMTSFVSANGSKCSYTSDFPNLQTGITNMHGDHNLHFSALSLRLGRAVQLVHLSLPTKSLHGDSCLCILKQFIFFATANTPYSNYF